MYNVISGPSLLTGGLDFVGATYPPGFQPQQLAYYQQQQAPMLAAALAQRQAALAHPGYAQPGYYGNQQNLQEQFLQAALAQKQVQAGALLQTMNPTRARKQVLGMESNGTIAANGTATITARPQTFAFKPERIFIPATVGTLFTIQDIKVGNISQLVQSGNLPAEAFSQTAFGVEMDMDTVQTSQDFIIQVTNVGGAPATFRAMILGRSANG